MSKVTFRNSSTPCTTAPGSPCSTGTPFCTPALGPRDDPPTFLRGTTFRRTCEAPPTIKRGMHYVGGGLFLGNVCPRTNGPHTQAKLEEYFGHYGTLHPTKGIVLSYDAQGRNCGHGYVSYIGTKAEQDRAIDAALGKKTREWHNVGGDSVDVVLRLCKVNDLVEYDGERYFWTCGCCWKNGTS